MSECGNGSAQICVHPTRQGHYLLSSAACHCHFSLFCPFLAQHLITAGSISTLFLHLSLARGCLAAIHTTIDPGHNGGDTPTWTGGHTSTGEGGMAAKAIGFVEYEVLVLTG